MAVRAASLMFLTLVSLVASEAPVHHSSSAIIMASLSASPPLFEHTTFSTHQQAHVPLKFAPLQKHSIPQHVHETPVNEYVPPVTTKATPKETYPVPQSTYAPAVTTYPPPKETYPPASPPTTEKVTYAPAKTMYPPARPQPVPITTEAVTYAPPRPVYVAPTLNKVPPSHKVPASSLITQAIVSPFEPPVHEHVAPVLVEQTIQVPTDTFSVPEPIVIAGHHNAHTGGYYIPYLIPINSATLEHVH